MSLFDIITGRTETHLTPLEGMNRLIHKDAWEDFKALSEAAMNTGFEIYITSSYRNYENQLSIWNEKAMGKRTLLDPQGRPLEYKDLSEKEIVNSIMRWSAIPGCSRHHWGTDIDIVDKLSIPEGYQVELTPQEVSGMFKEFYSWVCENLENFNFFHPYKEDLGGVCPEMWHISYAPVANAYLKALDLEVFEQIIDNERLELNHILKEDPQFYYQNFLLNISKP